MRERLAGLVWGALPWAAVPLAALAFQRWLRAGLDLRDLPGPGSGQTLAQALDGGWTGAAWWLEQCIARWGIAAGAQAYGEICLLMGVVGAMLLARALAGPRAAVLAGVLVGAWAHVQLNTLLVGFDGLALGLGAVALGMAATGARAGPWGLPLVFAAGPLMAYAGACKETALPGLVLLLAAPLLAGSWRRGGLAASALALGLGLGVALYLPAIGLPGQEATQHRLVEGLPEPSLSLAAAGLTAAWAKTGGHWQHLTGQLLLLAALGACHPGRRLGARGMLAALALVATGLAAAHAGDRLLLRHLLVAALPVPVLAGVAVAALVGRARRLWPAAAIVSALLAASLGLDTLDRVHAFATAREAYSQARPTTLPPAPVGWAGRNRLTWEDARGVGMRGGPELMDLLADAPGGIAIPLLRDHRSDQARVGAAMAGKAGLVLEWQRCCPQGQASRSCASDLVQTLDAAGAWLVLPRVEGHDPRQDQQGVSEWVGWLRSSAVKRMALRQGAQWEIYSGEGSGPMPVCR